MLTGQLLSQSFIVNFGNSNAGTIGTHPSGWSFIYNPSTNPSRAQIFQMLIWGTSIIGNSGASVLSFTAPDGSAQGVMGVGPTSFAYSVSPAANNFVILQQMDIVITGDSFTGGYVQGVIQYWYSDY